MGLSAILLPGTPTSSLTPHERNHKLLSAAFCLLCSAVAYGGVAISTTFLTHGHGSRAQEILHRNAFLDGPGCVSREKLLKTVYNEDGFAVAVKACEDMIDVSQVSIPRKP